jgi:L-iditol 2-dehydrogenase
VRVAVYYANDDVRIEERPRPATGADELLLRVMASGVCGSDVMEWYRKPRAPLVLGHEVAGLVEEAGERVTEFRAGDRIVTTHHVPCNRCRYCLSDRHSVCETLNSTNFDPGGFSELVRLPAINVERGTFGLPDDVSFEEGTFVEPLACVIRGQRLAGLRAGDGVAILGSGISGILHLLLARATGAGRIFATDTSDYRVKAAVALGADLAVHAGPDVVALARRRRISRFTRGPTSSRECARPTRDAAWIECWCARRRNRLWSKPWISWTTADRSCISRCPPRERLWNSRRTTCGNAAFQSSTPTPGRQPTCGPRSS